jgi:WD40 repeat protein/predicted Ser/Thr protein kinase
MHEPHDKAAESVKDLPITALTPADVRVTLVYPDSGAVASVHAPPAVPGYEVEVELGRGGMGIVYKARQVALNREVALKIVLAGARANADDVTRFLAEAEFAARLRHQGVVQIYESGRYDGLPYYTMEYVSGGTLAARLAAGRPSRDEATRTALALSEAVAAAHASGVVHRDLKPANILLAADGTPKITDFGLARRLDAGAGLTQNGSILGTPSYMAPEQARGDPDAARPPADVYSLGAILYEMLTGKPPFRAGNSVSTLALVLNTRPENPRASDPDVPRDLETIALKCLEKNAARRYPSADALAGDLRRFREGRPIFARRATAAERVVLWAKRNPAVAALLAAVMISLTAGTVVSVLFALRSASNAELADANGRRFAAAAEEAERKAAEADAARDEAQRQVVRLDLVTARSHADKREYDSAAHWVARAWLDDLARLPAGASLTPSEEADHRIEVGDAIEKLNRMVGFGAHVSPVLDADCDPTGDRVVALTGDELARVWDAPCGALAYPPLRHGGKVTSAAFSAKGDRIVTSSADGSVRLWNAANGELLREFRAGGPVARAALSPDGATVAAASGNRVLRWDSVTGEPWGEPIAVGDPTEYVAYSPDSGKLVTAGPRGLTRVWDAATGKPIGEPVRHARFSTAGADWSVQTFEARRWPVFSPDGTQLAAARDANTITVRVPSADRTIAAPPEQGRRSQQLEAVFVPGGPLVAYVRRPGNLLSLYDTAAGRVVGEFGTGRFANGVQVSPDGKLAAVPISGGEVLLFNLPAGTPAGPPLRHAAIVSQFRFTRDGRRLMTASIDGTVRVWSLPGQTDPPEPYRLDCGRADRFASADHRYSPDGVWEAVRVEGGVRLSRVGGAPGPVLPHPVRVLQASGEVPYGFVFSPDGRHLLTIGADDFRVWAVGDGEPRCLGTAPDRRVVHAEFSGDGRRLVTLCRSKDFTPQTGSLGDAIEVWDVPGLGRSFGPVGADVPRLMSVAINRDGTLVVAKVFGSGRPPCWDLRTGRLTPEVRLRPGDMHHPRFGDRDDRILVRMTTGETYQWDARSGRLAGPTLRTVAAGVGRLLAYSPDQRRILIHIPNSARLYDADSGELLAARRLTEAPVAMWFSADGRRVLIQDSAGTVNVWRLPEFAGPPDRLTALIEVMGGTKQVPEGGIISLDETDILARPETYLRAWRAWRGLPD